MSTRTILVPVDGSEVSGRILEVAEGFMGAGSQVVLLRVTEPRGVLETVQAHRERLDGAWVHLERLRDQLLHRGVDARALLQEGAPDQVILAAAEREAASLVVMTTHGRSGLPRWLLGSVAERVLRGATAPLLLATPKALAGGPGYRRLLVPLDGSADAAAVLPLALELARSLRAPVTLFRVSPVLPVQLDHPLPAPAPTPDELAEGIEGARRELATGGVDVCVAVSYGPAAREISAEASAVPGTLVVMATHGRTGLPRWLHGSTAEEVVRACECPVLVQRLDAVAQPDGLPAVQTL